MLSGASGQKQSCEEIVAQPEKTASYFPFGLQIAGAVWARLDLGRAQDRPLKFQRLLAERLNALPEQQNRLVKAGTLNLYRLLLKSYRSLLGQNLEERHAELILAVSDAGDDYPGGELGTTIEQFAYLFPPQNGVPAGRLNRQQRLLIVQELLILRIAQENPALDPFRLLFDDRELAASSPYLQVMAKLEGTLCGTRLSAAQRADAALNLPLAELLRAPLRASPQSLRGQVEYVQQQWQELLPQEIAVGFGILQEETRTLWPPPTPFSITRFLPIWAAGRLSKTCVIAPWRVVSDWPATWCRTTQGSTPNGL